MVKRLFLILAVALMLTVCMAVSVSAYEYGEYYDGYYDSYDDGPDFGISGILLVSVGAGFVISLVLVSVKKSAMRTVRPEKTANAYVVKNSLVLTVQNDVFIREYTTRTPIQRKN